MKNLFFFFGWTIIIFCCFMYYITLGQEYTGEYWADTITSTTWSNSSYTSNSYVGYFHGIFSTKSISKLFSSPSSQIKINLTVYSIASWDSGSTDYVKIYIDNNLVSNLDRSSLNSCTGWNTVVSNSQLFYASASSSWPVCSKNIQISTTVSNPSSWNLTLVGHFDQTWNDEAWGFNNMIIQTNSASVPTSSPTLSPTSPTYVDCTNELKIFNWSDETNDKYIPYSNIETTLINDNDNANILLNVKVTAEYLCNSYSNAFGSGTYLPITYVLDTSIFTAHGRNIYDPNSCENRISSSFNNKTWNDDWTCSYVPSESNNIGSTDYLSYPPSNIWDISMLSSCGNISWTTSITINELSSCTDENDDTTYQWTETSNAIILSGYFYLTLVSPMYKNYDSKYYNIYSLQQDEIQIKFMKSVYVLNGNAGVKLFGITNIAKYIVDDVLYFVFMTWSANYVNLKYPKLIYPTEYDNPLNIYDYSSSQDCIFSSTYRCYQLWIVNTTLDTCDANVVLNFTSNYLINTNFNCLNNDANSCDDLYSSNGDSYDINLDYSLFYQTTCNLDIFNITFDGSLYWYDNEFTTILDNPTYQLEDTAYVEISVNNLGQYNIASVSLVNVWLCTSSDSLTVDSVTGLGGCFSSNVDANLFQIFTNGAPYDTDTNGAIIDSNDDTKVRFSFVVPSLSRSSFYIQAQVELELTNSTTRRRVRRLLSSSSSSQSINQNIQLISSAGAQQSYVNNNNNNDNNNNNLIIIYSSIGGGILFTLLIIAVIIYYYKHKNNGSDKKLAASLNNVQTILEITQPK